MLNADVDVDDVTCEDGKVTLFAKASEFYKAKTALLEAFPKLELEVAEITFHPQTTKTLTVEDAAQFEKFLALLNDCDDVQEVYHNAVMPD
jgi:transcriptional/translational regulatory protein YebC/TACO1